jgi:pimeloyl-ACP methyl ester carboxylesterase
LSAKTLSLTNHKCPAIINQAPGVPIVFLHGYSYTSEVWPKTGITDILKEKQLPFLALDMPYGLRSRCKPKTRNTETNIAVIKEATQSTFGAVPPILVGASLGGHIALNYAARLPVKALFLLAPVRTLQEELTQAYSQFNFPVRIIIGSEDRIASTEELRELAGKLPNGKLIIYENAGHSAYITFPERFRRDLLELYALVEQKPTAWQRQRTGLAQSPSRSQP